MSPRPPLALLCLLCLVGVAVQAMQASERIHMPDNDPLQVGDLVMLKEQPEDSDESGWTVDWLYRVERVTKSGRKELFFLAARVGGGRDAWGAVNNERCFEASELNVVRRATEVQQVPQQTRPQLPADDDSADSHLLAPNQHYYSTQRAEIQSPTASDGSDPNAWLMAGVTPPPERSEGSEVHSDIVVVDSPDNDSASLHSVQTREEVQVDEAHPESPTAQPQPAHAEEVPQEATTPRSDHDDVPADAEEEAPRREADAEYHDQLLPSEPSLPSSPSSSPMFRHNEHPWPIVYPQPDPLRDIARQFEPLPREIARQLEPLPREIARQLQVEQLVRQIEPLLEDALRAMLALRVSGQVERCICDVSRGISHGAVRVVEVTNQEVVQPVIGKVLEGLRAIRNIDAEEFAQEAARSVGHVARSKTVEDIAATAEPALKQVASTCEDACRAVGGIFRFF